MINQFTIRKLEVFAVRVPIVKPIVTSFGAMTNRPSLLVRIEDTDGIAGWGEIWCNFPADAAEHRARLLTNEIGPLLKCRLVPSPSQMFQSLTTELQILANQSGEIGPIAQVLAGVDIALWDIAAKRAKMPLWKYLGGQTNSVPVYASGFSPLDLSDSIPQAIDNGHIAFKIKIGFSRDTDTKHVELARRLLGSMPKLMVDVNQAWSIKEAIVNVENLSEFGLTWIEEPIRSNSPESHWGELANVSSAPLAAGENLNHENDFDHMIRSQTIRFIQPDVAKWGGISGCSIVAEKTNRYGLCYCPHWLGGGVGLLASAHLLAANPGCGMLELDINPNPIREFVWSSQISMTNSMMILSDLPGLGVEPPEDLLSRYLIHI